MKIRFAILCMIGVSAGSATAQVMWTPPIGVWQGNQSFNNQRITEMLQSDATADAPSSKARPPVSPLLLRYVPSAARRKSNLAKFAVKGRDSDPAGAAKMAQLFASTDVIGQIGAEMSSYGLRIDNVADAYAVYWINAWEAAHGIVGKAETRSRAQAVKAQAERAMSGSPEMVRATGAQKQEFAEALLVQAAMISAHMANAAGDPAQLAAVAKAVRQGAKAMGLDLDTMVLTDQGFRPAGGT
jgi:hypothetical protein